MRYGPDTCVATTTSEVRGWILDKSKIMNNSIIINSTIENSTISNSEIINQTIKNQTITNSKIQGPTEEEKSAKEE